MTKILSEGKYGPDYFELIDCGEGKIRCSCEHGHTGQLWMEGSFPVEVLTLMIHYVMQHITVEELIEKSYHSNIAKVMIYKETDFGEFMTAMCNAPKNLDPNACDKCNGYGLEAKHCCNGVDCGCWGLPIDYTPCECEASVPKISEILDWNQIK